MTKEKDEGGAQTLHRLRMKAFHDKKEELGVWRKDSSFLLEQRVAWVDFWKTFFVVRTCRLVANVCQVVVICLIWYCGRTVVELETQ